MARFIQPQQQNIVSLYSPKNVEFYSSILDKAQNNLERSTAIKAAALEKMGDLTFYSKEDREATLGRVQEMLKNATEADFVSPTKVTNAVMQANAEVMPYVQALKAKDKEAQLQRQLRAQWGTDFIGNDVASASIVGSDGQAVDPSNIRGINYNAEQFRKLFHDTEGAKLLQQIESGFIKTYPGIISRKTTKGIKDPSQYQPGTEYMNNLVQGRLGTLPENVLKDLEFITGGREGVSNYLGQVFSQAANDPKYAYTESFQDTRDPNFIDAETRARLDAGKESGTPTVLFKPQDSDVEQVDIVSDALNQHLGNSETKMNASEISFDASGKILPAKTQGSVAVVNPYGQVQGYKTPSLAEQAKGLSKNTAQNKLITSMRRDLQDQDLGVVKDTKTGKYRARTDKEVYEFYTTAANNSANVFGKSFQINPGLDIIGANAFFYPNGKRKDFKDVNIELNYNDGKGWQQVDETKLAEELGYDITDGKKVKEFNDALRTLGSDSYDFMTGDTKVRSALTNQDGQEVSMRYNAPPEVRDYKKPIAEMYNAFVKPVRNKKVYVGQDKDTGKPIIITLNSKFASYGGKPVIYPEASIDESTPSGQRYKAIYDVGGYEALLAEIQQSTDDAIVNTGNVYVRKAVNTRDIPE